MAGRLAWSFATRSFALALVALALPAGARADVPTIVTRPTLSGTAGPLYPGMVLTHVHGTWTGSPTSLSVQWQSCPLFPRRPCEDVPGAVGTTYTIREADVDHSITSYETATNRDGVSAPAPNLYLTSNVLATPPAPIPTPTATPAPTPRPPLPPPPEVVTNPKLTGRTVVGRTLKVTPGTWTSQAPVTYAYTWYLCHGPCSKIPGATEPKLLLIPAYVGNSVLAMVTAANDGGINYAYSNATFGPIGYSVRDRLLQALTSDGPRRRIGRLLKHRGYRIVFDAPHPGVVQVRWTTSVTRGGKRRSVLVAGGTELMVGRGVVNLELTPKGAKLLRRARRLTVTASGRFGVGRRTIASATAEITLVR